MCEGEDCFTLGKIPGRVNKVVEKKLESNAYGCNEFFLLDCPGIFILDILTYLRKEVKLDSYKLEAVSSKFLNEHKLDVTPKFITASWSEGLGDCSEDQAFDRGDVGLYCVQVRIVCC